MPNKNSPNLKEFAQYLLAIKPASGKSVRSDGVAEFHICEDMRLLLGRVVGVAGYRSLFSRALALAGAHVPWLRRLHIRADGRLEGLAELKSKLNDEQIALGEVALVAELLALMVTFIGPTLTLHLMQQAWSEADFSKFEF